MVWLEVAAQAVLLLLALVVALPAALLLAQVLLALLPARPNRMSIGVRPRVAVLVPAHDESRNMLPTLAQIQAQLQPGDRLLVVADNCSDDTAAVARAAGAEVAERNERSRRGKGYALDHGVSHLAADPPAVVIVIDADCTLKPGCIELLARVSHGSDRPVQANFMTLAADASLRMRMAEFAMRVKAHVRPRAMQRLGLPCGLIGSGIAYPWHIAAQAPFASGHLAEDMQLGIELGQRGTPPVYCEDAKVETFFAASHDAQRTQRTRWEHGHLTLLLQDGPRMLARALRHGHVRVALQIADMLVPPLALLVLLQLAGVAAALAAGWLLDSWLPLAVALAGAAMLLVAIALARARFASDIVSTRDLLLGPAYVATKLPIYVRFLVSRQVEWVRTKRSGTP